MSTNSNNFPLNQAQKQGIKNKLVMKHYKEEFYEQE